MAVIVAGKTFANGEQLTAEKINNITALSTFDPTNSVDNASTDVVGGAIVVRDLGITVSKIADLAVSTAKIASNAVTTAKILDANVTFAKLTDVIDDDTMATASDTKLATSESIKAYVDNLIDSSALPSQSGGVATEGEQGSYTLPSGLIIKYGTLDSNASITSYSFTTAFPTAIIGVNATVNESVSSAAETCGVSSPTTSGFDLLGYQNNSGALVGRVFWIAYGF
jgi:hypothetical protein